MSSGVRCPDCDLRLGSVGLLIKHQNEFCVGPRRHLRHQTGPISLNNNHTDAFTCPNCSLDFASRGLLLKHQNDYCLGSSDMLDQGLYQDPVVRESKTPDNISQAKILELEQLKRRKAELRRERDRRERQLLEHLKDQAGDLQAADRQSSTESGMSVELPITPQDDSQETNRNDFKKNPAPSFHPRHPQHQQPRQRHYLQPRADAYQRNLLEYKKINDKLFTQKQDIENRLSEIEQSTPKPTGVDLLHKLTSLQEENERNLRELQRKLDSANKTPGKMPSDNFLLMEISKMRQRYLELGGNNPEIFMQFANIESEALGLAARHQKEFVKQNKYKENEKELNDQLAAYELENKRLELQLAKLYEDNSSKLERESRVRQDNESLLSRQEEQLQEMARMEHELEIATQQVELEKMRSKLEKLEAMSHRSSLSTTTTNRISPQPRMTFNIESGPYNKTSGFVVFYDFLTGLDPDVTRVQLSSCLYTTTTMFTKTSVLPPTECSRHKSFGVTAIVHYIQPVPRCPSDQNLGLVLELQASHQGGPLKTIAWCKVYAFDSRSWLKSGAWRVPFRSLPIRPYISGNELNATPKDKRAELFMRIVNHREANIQSSIPVTPDSHASYEYL